MTYKLTCPSCDRYLSSIFEAYSEGRPCPICGAGLAAASEQYYRQLADDHLPVYELGDPEAPYGLSAMGGGYVIVEGQP